MVNVSQLLATSHIPTRSLDSSAPAPMGTKKGSQYTNWVKETLTYLEFVIRFLAWAITQIMKLVRAAAALMVTMEQFNLLP